MPSRDELIAFMDAYLEKDKFRDYCPIGLQVEGKSEVTRVATGVSASLESFERAAEWNADMIAVHHGMFFENADRVVRGHLRARLKCLLDNDITLVGYHLPLDAHPEIGNNALFARAMGFRNLAPFGEHRGILVGRKGEIEPIPIESFAAKAEAFYGAKPFAALHGKPRVASAAVVSGGAWDDVLAAARAGVDCFVTGSADEPAWYLAREEKIHFLAFGHHATEKCGIQRLGELLAEKIGLETRFFDTANPL